MKNDKPVVIYISHDAQHQYEFAELLADSFNFIPSCTVKNGLRHLSSFKKSSVAVLIDEECGLENNHIFFSTIENIPFLVLPIVIAVCFDSPQNGGKTILSLGANDIIMPPFHADIIVNRIKNTMQAASTKNFEEMQNALKELPANIYLKDEKGRYIFCTKDWQHKKSINDSDWDIRGKTDLEIRKDKENAIKAMETDKSLLKSGNGADYIVEIGSEGDQGFLEIIKRPVRNKDGIITGIIGLVSDVTQKELLKIHLEKASTTDSLTGVLNRGTMYKLIKDSLFDFKEKKGKLCLLMFDLDDFKKVNDTYGHQNGDIVLTTFADILLNSHFGKAKAGRWGGEEFMLLLYDTEITDAILIGERIRQCFAEIDFLGIGHHTVSVGVTQAKLNDSAESFCARTDDALYQAKASGKNTVVFQ